MLRCSVPLPFRRFCRLLSQPPVAAPIPLCTLPAGQLLLESFKCWPHVVTSCLATRLPFAGFLLGSRQTLLETFDGGKTWEPRTVQAAQVRPFVAAPAADWCGGCLPLPLLVPVPVVRALQVSLKRKMRGSRSREAGEAGGS